jgi:hypothetical protein
VKPCTLSQHPMPAQQHKNSSCGTHRTLPPPAILPLYKFLALLLLLLLLLALWTNVRLRCRPLLQRSLCLLQLPKGFILHRGRPDGRLTATAAGVPRRHDHPRPESSITPGMR